jgi:hypothetical protein
MVLASCGRVPCAGRTPVFRSKTLGEYWQTSRLCPHALEAWKDGISAATIDDHARSTTRDSDRATSIVRGCAGH